MHLFRGATAFVRLVLHLFCGRLWHHSHETPPAELYFTGGRPRSPECKLATAVRAPRSRFWDPETTKADVTVSIARGAGNFKSHADGAVGPLGCDNIDLVDRNLLVVPGIEIGEDL